MKAFVEGDKVYCISKSSADEIAFTDPTGYINHRQIKTK